MDIHPPDKAETEKTANSTCYIELIMNLYHINVDFSDQFLQLCKYVTSLKTNKKWIDQILLRNIFIVQYSHHCKCFMDRGVTLKLNNTQDQFVSSYYHMTY